MGSKKYSIFPSRFQRNGCLEPLSDIEIQCDDKKQKIVFFRKSRLFDEYWIAKLFFRNEDKQVAIISDGLQVYMNKGPENDNAIEMLKKVFENYGKKENKHKKHNISSNSELSTSPLKKAKPSLAGGFGGVPGSASRQSHTIDKLQQASSSSSYGAVPLVIKSPAPAVASSAANATSSHTSWNSHMESDLQHPPIQKTYGRHGIQQQSMLSKTIFDASNLFHNSNGTSHKPSPKTVTTTPVDSVLSPQRDSGRDFGHKSSMASILPTLVNSVLSPLGGNNGRGSDNPAQSTASSSDGGSPYRKRPPYIQHTPPTMRLHQGVYSRHETDGIASLTRARSDSEVTERGSDDEDKDWKQSFRQVSRRWLGDTSESTMASLTDNNHQPLAPGRNMQHDHSDYASVSPKDSRSLFSIFSNNLRNSVWRSGGSWQSNFTREGMRNFGNSCYINATLQALLSVAPLTMDYSSGLWTNLVDHVRSIEGSSSNEEGGTLVELLTVFAGVIRNSARNSSTVSQFGSRQLTDLAPLKALVDRHSMLFHGSGQQDAHEFLMEFLHTVHQASLELVTAQFEASPRLRGLVEQGGCDAFSKLKQQAMLETLVPTSRHLHAEVSVEMRCVHCGHCKEPKQEVYRDFSLDLPSSGLALLPDLLKGFFADEERDVDCEHCKEQPSKSTVSTRLVSLPNVLIIHLKRFRYDPQLGRFDKLMVPVKFPLNFNLSEVGVPHVPSWAVSKVRRSDLEMNSIDEVAASAVPAGVLCELVSLTPTKNPEAIGSSLSENGAVNREDDRKSWEQAIHACMLRPVTEDAKAMNSDDQIRVSQFEAQLLPQASPVGVTLASPDMMNCVSKFDSNDDKIALRQLGIQVEASKQSTNSDYSLVSVIRHLGPSAACGHFICDTKCNKPKTGAPAACSTPSWERCNDSLIQAISQDAVLQETSSVYVLIYARPSY